MVRARVVIEGDEELRELLQNLIDGVTDYRELGPEIAEPIATRAFDQAPADSGRLRDDIRTFANKSNAGVRVGRKRVPYAGPIVGGHGARSAPRAQGGWVLPNPFIFDAADDRRRDVVARWEGFIDRLIEGEKPKAEHKYRLHNID